MDSERAVALCQAMLLEFGDGLQPKKALAMRNANQYVPNLLELLKNKKRTTHSGGYYHDVVIHALRNCGYRMIDTARRYGVERELGFAWKESGVPRSELFLCSKLWPVNFGSGTREAFELSCEKLQTDYLGM
ncbi:hypothetical protein OSTOST_15540, partial [Ostertagia ostertagi]